MSATPADIIADMEIHFLKRFIRRIDQVFGVLCEKRHVEKPRTSRKVAATGRGNFGQNN